MLRQLLVYGYTPKRAVSCRSFFIERKEKMNNIYKKSTLQAWNLSAQAAAVNDVLNFNNSQKTGCAVEFANGTGSVTIRKPGLYQIAFNGVAVESGTAGDVAVQLQKNGADVPGAIAQATSANATAVVNPAFETIVEVPQSCACVNNTAVLTVKNIGVAANFANANLSVVKLC
jgi:hypothetical protein